MRIASLKLAAVLVLAVIGAGPTREDDDLPPTLSTEKFAKYFEAIRPYPGEWRWREDIPWVGTIHEARARAAKENKPILAWKSADSPTLGAT